MGAKQSQPPRVGLADMSTPLFAPAGSSDSSILGVPISVIVGLLKKYPKSTTEEICDLFIRRETIKQQCSYIESQMGSEKNGIPLVAPATCFVVHTRSAPFAEAVDAMLQYENSHPHTYFWIDILSCNQHKLAENTVDLCSSVRDRIRSIRSVLLVISPWNNPALITRVWCLWEIYSAIDTETPMQIAIPASQRTDFKSHVVEDHEAILRTITSIDAYTAEATKACDKEHILLAIKARAGGLEAFNMRVRTHIRDQYLAAAVAVAEEEFRLGAEDETTAKLFNQIGTVMWSKSNYDKAIEYLSKSLQIYMSIFGINHPTTATSFTNLGNAYEEKGEHDKAIECYSENLKIYLSILGENHTTTATSYLTLGAAMKSKGEYDKAIQYVTKSIAIRLAALGENHPDTASSYNVLASTYSSKGDIQQAIDIHTKSLKLKLEPVAETSGTSQTYMELGTEYGRLSTQEFDKAIQFYVKSLQIRRTTCGENHPSTASSYLCLGNAYYYTAEYTKAIENYAKASAIRLALFGDKFPETATSLSNLGNAYTCAGLHAKAADCHERCLQIRLAVFTENHPSTAASYHNLGMALSGMNEHDRAIECFLKDLKVCRVVMGDGHPSTAHPLTSLGQAYCAKSQYPKAVSRFKQALAIRLAVLGEEHAETATAYSNLGYAHLCNGEYDKAIDCHSRSLKIRLTALKTDHSRTLQRHRIRSNERKRPALDLDRATSDTDQCQAAAIRDRSGSLSKEGSSDLALFFWEQAKALGELGDVEHARTAYEVALHIGEATLGSTHPDTIKMESELAKCAV